MIDTIVLILNKSAYAITDPDKFKPSARWALGDACSAYRQSKQNFTKSEVEEKRLLIKLVFSNLVLKDEKTYLMGA